jgi:hypothetical protein
MPHQVHGALLHAKSGTELPRVRTELRPFPPEPINPSARVELGGHLLCNQVDALFRYLVKSMDGERLDIASLEASISVIALDTVHEIGRR